MKNLLAQLVEQAIGTLQADGTLPAGLDIDVQVERGRGEGHGDFATNTAMRVAKPARRPPRELAQALVDALPPHRYVERVEIAGPGFINFFLTADAAFAVIRDVWEQGEAFGRSRAGEGRRILVEFVSANPTGPLHVGHGRGAAFGSALASLLATAGFDVQREYYVNDAGRQMDILAVSVLLRYLEQRGKAVRFPDNGYRGDYIRDIASGLAERDGDAYRIDTAALTAKLPADASDGGDKEAHVDALVRRSRELLGEARYRAVLDAALEAILADIRDDLGEFGVHFDRWFSERSLTENGAVGRTIERLVEAGHCYEADGALWFRATDFGDDKDRVIRRADGLTTYFASDIAYHLDKFERGFDQLIDVFGADHHGYMARVRASLEAFGYPADRLEFRLVQFAILYRGAERLPMSTRSGEFVTLRELREEVGNDAARFFYVMRRPEQHLDFDLELAKSESADNPVYYLQYAHARICSVLRQLDEQGLDHDPDAGFQALARLTEDHEQALISQLGRFPEVIETAALAHEPHQLAHYLRELAGAFHTYYNAHQFLVDDAELRNARLNLVLATRQVLRNGLRVLAVNAPERM
ncbi:arginine--tRNA ligase [Arhodomonas aquaeolei]|uniref:arginine--tRNA ligase n=1 Tax=Arhodomonas aquaeolei TaxID=2369 RepID=UPI002166DE32|nr:arginine--tRNA ligase [Arhodomonas aquaeolei]MCS4505911.1 arginine--tRNA ligase [Arhodomonas aquaeolei]